MVGIARVAALASLLVSSVVHAQAPPPPPLPPSEAPLAIADEPELRAAYDRAFSLLISEQWDAAQKAFADVAARSTDRARRSAAAELGRFAHEMDERGEDGPKRTSGRASFVTTTTLASFYAGFVLDDVLAIDDYKQQTLVVTGATLGGFAAALFGTQGKTITESMASAYGSGLLVGLGNGLLLAPRLGIDAEGEPGDGAVNQVYLGFGLATMAAGGAVATYLASRYDPTPAQAQFAGVMAINGFATVGLGLVIGEADEMKYENVLALLALGLNGGVVAGVVVGRELTWSKSRLTYVTLAEFLGGLTAVAAAVVILDDDSGGNGNNRERVGAAMVLGGIWGGFGLAAHLTRDMAPDPRYRIQGGATMSLAPFVGDHGARGVSVAGTF